MQQREALSAREAARTFGISADRICAAIARGELEAARLGTRRYQILREDLVSWLRRNRAAGAPARPELPQVSAHAAAVAEGRLDREAVT